MTLPHSLFLRERALSQKKAKALSQRELSPLFWELSLSLESSSPSNIFIADFVFVFERMKELSFYLHDSSSFSFYASPSFCLSSRESFLIDHTSPISIFSHKLFLSLRLFLILFQWLSLILSFFAKELPNPSYGPYLHFFSQACSLSTNLPHSLSITLPHSLFLCERALLSIIRALWGGYD